MKLRGHGQLVHKSLSLVGFLIQIYIYTTFFANGLFSLLVANIFLDLKTNLLEKQYI